MAATTTQQSIPWARGYILISYNSGASARTTTIVNNPANSRSTDTIEAESIAAGAYRVHKRYPAQDNNVLLVTGSNAELMYAVIKPN